MLSSDASAGPSAARAAHDAAHPCRSGEIGRRRGLKIPRRKVCRFESGLRHQLPLPDRGQPLPRKKFGVSGLPFSLPPRPPCPSCDSFAKETQWADMRAAQTIRYYFASSTAGLVANNRAQGKGAASGWWRYRTSWHCSLLLRVRRRRSRRKVIPADRPKISHAAAASFPTHSATTYINMACPNGCLPQWGYRNALLRRSRTAVKPTLPTLPPCPCLHLSHVPF